MTQACEDSRILLIPEQSKSHVVAIGTKQKPYFLCRNKTRAMLLILEQNKSHVVDAKIRQKLYFHEQN